MLIDNLNTFERGTKFFIGIPRRKYPMTFWFVKKDGTTGELGFNFERKGFISNAWSGFDPSNKYMFTRVTREFVKRRFVKVD